MKSTKTLSVSLPPNQLKQMEWSAKKENRTMSELVRELYRRYVADEARRDFGRALEALRAEAAKAPVAKLTMRQIEAEIAASRRVRKQKLAR